MNLYQIVDARERGEIPVSIGTALALAAAGGTYPERPKVVPPPIDKVKSIVFNVKTLYRNLIGSVDRTELAKVKPEHLAPALHEDMAVIDTFVKEKTSGRCSALFYLSDYKQVNDREFKGAMFKIPSTDNQKTAAYLEEQTLKLLLTRQLPAHFAIFSGELKGKFPASLWVTHCPVDLLQRSLFEHVELLESHTGAIKPYGMWGSKLNGQVPVTIPFNRFTLKVFGDGVHFTGQRPTLKKAVVDAASSNHWTGLSTMALIENSISKIRDSGIRDELKTLL